MNKLFIIDIIEDFNFYWDELLEAPLEEEDELRDHFLDFVLLSNSLILHPKDRAVLTSLCSGDTEEQLEKLSLFNGQTTAFDTFNKFVNIFTQAFEGNPIVLNNLENLYITEELFEGWDFDNEELFLKCITDGNFKLEMKMELEEDE